jgi:hypothetical protein
LFLFTQTRFHSFFARAHEDGFYGYGFFHKGKVATYTVDAGIYGGIKEVQLKAGKFAEVNFARAWVWVNF